MVAQCWLASMHLPWLRIIHLESVITVSLKLRVVFHTFRLPINPACLTKSNWLKLIKIDWSLLKLTESDWQWQKGGGSRIGFRDSAWKARQKKLNWRGELATFLHNFWGWISEWELVLDQGVLGQTSVRNFSASQRLWWMDRVVERHRDRKYTAGNSAQLTLQTCDLTSRFTHNVHSFPLKVCLSWQPAFLYFQLICVETSLSSSHISPSTSEWSSKGLVEKQVASLRSFRRKSRDRPLARSCHNISHLPML